MKRSRYSVSRSIYSLLLLLYPRSFRTRFGEQMREDFRDMLITHCGSSPVRGRLETWQRVVRDTVASLPRERFGRGRSKKNGIGNGSTERNRLMLFSSLIADVRYAFRTWRKAPVFVAVAVFTITLGIGATTTIFSIANSLLIRTPTGVREPGSLVTVFTRRPGGSVEGMFSRATFEAFRDSETGLREVGALGLFMGSISTGAEAEPQRIAGLAVSANYFRILGTRPYLGRFFTADEDNVPATNQVAVLSHRHWVRRFGADSSIVGRTVNINRVPLTVVGIAEEGFQGHVTGYEFGVWIPLGSAERVAGRHTANELIGIGRLAENSSIGQVAAAFGVVEERHRELHPEDIGTRNLVVIPYGGMIELARGPVTLFVILLFGISGIVLLIACVNVAGMLLSRASSRSREIAVRLAIGAGRGTVVRQLLTESTMLFLLGGAGGTVLAIWATELLGSMRPPVPLPILISFTPDLRVLAFTLVVAFVTGVVFGLAPALQVTKPDIVSSLKDETGSGFLKRSRLRSVFVVAQVTGSVVLLVLAGVFARALSQADSVDLGFDPENVHVYSVDVSLHHYTSEEGETFFGTLCERASALPGVESTALAWVLPMGFDYIGTVFTTPDRADLGNEGLIGVALNAVTPEYFKTLRIGLIAGRVFTDEDREGTTPVVIVNQTAAEMFWPGQSAVGRQLQSDDDLYEVVGVTTNGTYRTVGEDPRPMIYMARNQRTASSASLVVRVAQGRSDIGREVSEIARGLDPDLPAQTNAPFAQVIGLSLLPNRAAAATAAAFGALGLVLAAVGLYGVLSYTVSLRLREIGIRIALGADKTSIRRLVVESGLRLVGLGLGLGLPVALGAAVLARSMLFGLSPADPVTLGGIVVLFAGVAIFASYVPARRATRIDPIIALRCD